MCASKNLPSMNCVSIPYAVVAMDAVQKANSGHPGTPMALAPLRMCFIHASCSTIQPIHAGSIATAFPFGRPRIHFALFHTSPLRLQIDSRRFESVRQLNSITPGHPEVGLTPGIETTTGPLGQGLLNAVGMAIAEAHLAAKFNLDGFSLVDHRTFAICSDGDFMEGASHEAASLAGHLGLGKLTVFYDDNHITIEGEPI